MPLPPPWPFDTIADDLVVAYVKVLQTLTGWGVLADSTKAVYPALGLPQPQEPFPAGYVYIAGVTSPEIVGTGKWVDIFSVHVRIIGGPITPRYKFDAEHAVYKLIEPVRSILRYRRYLEDPVTNAPFNLIVPENKLTVSNMGAIRAFDYSEQGKFIGIEVPTTIGLILNVQRFS